MTQENKGHSPRKLLAGGILLVLVIAAGVVMMFFDQRETVAAERASREAKLEAGPLVRTITVTESSGGSEIILIGEAKPFQTVTMYAKTSGYMEKILVDKGDHVEKDQVIATILAPEIDQEFNSATADLQNKERILKRDISLLEKKYISEQEKEISETAVKVAKARLKSISDQQQYRVLRAPFAGTVTARFADPGALLQNAANASSGALPVITVSQLDKIRVYVYVEQKDAASLKVGYPVEIRLFENAETKIPVSITRISGELDARTRMMLTEIDVDNSDSKLIPGSFVQVRIQLPGPSRLQIPREALIIKEGKYFVAMVTTESKLHFTPIKIGENTGEKITVTEGIAIGDKLAINIGDSQEEGQKVIVQK